MSHSEAIRDLLTRFPALKPKSVKRLLAARGIVVDTNLICVARLRHRRNQKAKQQTEGIVARLLEKLLDKHPGLYSVVEAAFEEVVRRLVDVAVSHPSFTDDQLADELAKAISEMPVKETFVARWTRIQKRILDEHPQYRRSMKLALGLCDPNFRVISVPVGEGLDALSDEQLEQAVIASLEKNFPAGPTVEDIARAYFESVQQRENRAAEEQREVAEAERDRFAWLCCQVLDELRSSEALSSLDINYDAVFFLVRLHLADHPDWSDDDITEKVIAGMEHEIHNAEQVPQQKASLQIEGLTIQSRP